MLNQKWCFVQQRSIQEIGTMTRDTYFLILKTKVAFENWLWIYLRTAAQGWSPLQVSTGYSVIKFLAIITCSLLLGFLCSLTVVFTSIYRKLKQCFTTLPWMQQNRNLWSPFVRYVFCSGISTLSLFYKCNYFLHKFIFMKQALTWQLQWYPKFFFVRGIFSIGSFPKESKT